MASRSAMGGAGGGCGRGRVPEDGDEGSGEDAGDCGGGGGASPVEGGEDDWRERGAVDGVGVEGFFEDGFGVRGDCRGPDAEQDDHQAADDEDLLVGGLGLDVADEDVVDEVGGGREEIVVGGGDDLGEDGSDEEGAEELKQAWRVNGGSDLCGGDDVDRPAGEVGTVVTVCSGCEAVEADVGEDLAGMVVDLAGGEEGGAGDSEGDDDGLEDDGADDPADDGAGGVLLGSWRRRISGTWTGCRA